MGRTREFDKDTALRNAMQVFWAKGYEGSSVQDLLTAMDIRRKSMYDTYGNKDALFKEALRLYIDDVNREITSLLDRGLPPRESIRALLLLILKNDSRYTGCMIVNIAVEQTPSDLDTLDMLSKEYELIRSVFEQLIKDGKKTGDITSDLAPVPMSESLLAAWAGMRVLARAFKDKEMLIRIADFMVRSL